jgi:hypothetical protein
MWFLFTDRGVVLAGKLDDSSKRLTRLQAAAQAHSVTEIR